MPSAERRLAAIMFTDLVGYTSLSRRNEALALRLLEEHRALVRPILTRGSGKEIKTTGDGFLVEFNSALEAVRCAVEIQRAIHGVNSAGPSRGVVAVRIGIHLGDVVHNDNDVYGDAVNVASRIESLADPGSILISEQVYDVVRNKFEIPITGVGARDLKGIDSLVEVYRVVLPWEAPPANLQEPSDRRRIAVLPMTNISPDPKDEYFADGMTEELISAISKVAGLTVISRTSVMKYRGTQMSVAEIRPQLRVGTVLEGSVRKSGDRVRIGVQLVDAASEGQLWSEVYDRKLEDVFAVQSDIAHKVANSLRVHLLPAEEARVQKTPTNNMEAYTLYLRGRNAWSERTQSALKKAIAYFEDAIRCDSRYALAYSGLADSYLVLENWGFMRPEETWPKVMEYSDKALEIDDSLAEAHIARATIMQAYFWDWDSAEEEFRRAIALNPNYATAHHWYGHGHLEVRGRYDEAIMELEKAQQLDPLSLIIRTNLGDALLIAGKADDAIRKYKDAIGLDPTFSYAHARLGLALASKSFIDEAISEVETALRISEENSENKAILAYVYHEAGRLQEANAILEELEAKQRTTYVSPALIAEVYSAFHETDLAFEWLGKAADARTSTLLMNLREPQFDPVRSDPRYKLLLKRVNLGG